MSFEFICHFGDTNADAAVVITSIARALSNDKSYKVIEYSKSSLKGRFTGLPEREEWSEDFILNVSSTEAYVAVHSGTRDLRQSLLERLSDCLDSIGLPERFDEE